MLFIFCLITWQIANYFSAPDEMDGMTSIAIMSSLATLFFLLTSVVLLMVVIFTKIKN
jgi:hypothetical protein